jgi:CrcB protein
MPFTGATLRALVMQLPVDPDLDGTSPHLRRPHAAVLVALGGMIGSLARAGVSDAIPVTRHGWPSATLTVNVVGSLALGLLLGLLHERYPFNRWLRPLLGTGFCGGFTTFSTFAVEVTSRSGTGRAPLALAYVVISVGASLTAAMLGVVAARASSRVCDPDALMRRAEHAARLANEDTT